MLVDLNSSNGTFLNGQRVVSAARLKDGDQIRVGNTLLVFGLSAPVAATLAPSHQYSGKFSGIGDLVDGSSILSAIDALEESVILQPPEAADAVAAWNIVYKLAELIGTTPKVGDFLERMSDIIMDHMLVDHLVVLMVQSGADDLVARTTRARGGQSTAHIETSSTILQHVLKKREGVLCANVRSDDRFITGDVEDSLFRLGNRSIICVPIVAGDQVHGVIHLDCSTTQHTYTQEQLRLAVAIGRLTGMAVENARLMDTRMRTERMAAMGETVAYLSHSIRNILQGLQGGADVIELGFRKDNKDLARSGWELVRRNLGRIFDLTMNMLTFSKQRQPRIQSANLNKVVEDVITLTRARADEKHISITAQLEEIPAVPMDTEGMHQAILNVLNNAIDASPADAGKVHLSTRYAVDSGNVVLTISDNGPGVSPAERTHIFEPFHSGKGYGGTGLGLAAARKIVDELGGRIELNGSQNGAVFHIHLPTVHVQLADSDKTHGPAQ